MGPKGRDPKTALERPDAEAPADEHTSLAELAAVLGLDPASYGGLPAASPVAELVDVPTREEIPMLDVVPMLASDEEEQLQEVSDLEPVDELAPVEPELDELEPVGELQVGELEPVDELQPVELAPAPADDTNEVLDHSDGEERVFRARYQARWAQRTADERAAAARSVTGDDLDALAFTVDPVVVAALMENAHFGVRQVRFLARAHPTSTGLELVTRRQDWLSDREVQRRLLQNPMIGSIVFGRVMNPKRLAETYPLALSRELPELVRLKLRALLKQKWQQAAPEERADLMFRTEARCLVHLTGCTFDAKTTAILCGRPINSVMFVQSVAKFAASPPGLLAHLFKQAFVKKNAGLKKMLLAHPNLPGEVKRQV